MPWLNFKFKDVHPAASIFVLEENSRFGTRKRIFHFPTLKKKDIELSNQDTFKIINENGQYYVVDKNNQHHLGELIEDRNASGIS